MSERISSSVTDVDSAFDPKKRQAQRDYTSYLEGRPTSDLGEMPEDQYYNRRLDNSAISAEEVHGFTGKSLKELAEAVRDAKDRGDKTAETDLTDAFMEKFAAMVERYDWRGVEEHWDGTLDDRDAIADRRLAYYEKIMNGGEAEVGNKKEAPSNNVDEHNEDAGVGVQVADLPSGAHTIDRDGDATVAIDVTSSGEVAADDESGVDLPVKGDDKPEVVDQKSTSRFKKIMRGIGSLAAGIFRKPEADVAADPGLRIINFLDRESSPARVVVTRESAASYHKFTGSEDVILNCPTEDGGVFGVYDGLGGTEGDSSEAGRIISDVMQRELSRPISEQHWEGLRVALWLAQRTARRAAAERGFGEQINTVGTTARLFDYGSDKICLGVIHVGDTTLFRIRDSKMMKLTPNQALEDRPNVVTNTYAPRREFDEEDSISVVPMRRGDRIILCSDGITGDWPDQKMTQDEIAAIARAETPEETADLLMLYGIRKDDDRAVLVFDV